MAPALRPMLLKLLLGEQAQTCWANRPEQQRVLYLFNCIDSSHKCCGHRVHARGILSGPPACYAVFVRAGVRILTGLPGC